MEQCLNCKNIIKKENAIILTAPDITPEFKYVWCVPCYNKWFNKGGNNG